jgi:hypothetical protein
VASAFALAAFMVPVSGAPPSVAASRAGGAETGGGVGLPGEAGVVAVGVIGPQRQESQALLTTTGPPMAMQPPIHSVPTRALIRTTTAPRIITVDITIATIDGIDGAGRHAVTIL